MKTTEITDEQISRLVNEMEENCVTELARATGITKIEAHQILHKSHRVFRTNFSRNRSKYPDINSAREALKELCYERSKLFKNAQHELETITRCRDFTELTKAYHKLSDEFKTLIMVGKFFKRHIKKPMHPKIVDSFMLFYDIGIVDSSKKKLGNAMQQWLHETTVLVKQKLQNK